MAFFGAYLDESIHRDGDVRVLAIAGYVGFAENYDLPALQWRESLDRIGVGEFHMTDYERDVGDFAASKVPQELARETFRDLVRIIQSLRVTPFAVWTDLREWPDVNRAYPKIVVDLCSILGQLVESSDGVVKIDYVADENLQHKRECLGAFDRVRREGPPYADTVKSFGFGDSRLFPPIQMADLLAYEIAKHQRNILVGRKGIRWPLAEISKTHQILGFSAKVARND